MGAKAISIVAVIVALAALGFSAWAFMEAQDANEKADNIIETLEDPQVAGIPLEDDGSLDEEALQEQFQQQPAPEDLEEEFDADDLEDLE